MASWNDLCRCCLSAESNVSLLDDRNQAKEKFREITTIEVKEDDGLPQKLCPDCHEILNTAFQFRQQCMKMDSELRLQLQSLLAQPEQVELEIEAHDENSDEELGNDPMKQLDKIIKREPTDSDDDCYYVLVIDDPKDKENEATDVAHQIKTEIQDHDKKINHENTNGAPQSTVINESTSDAFEKSSFDLSSTKVPVNVPATILENEEECPEVENLFVSTMEVEDSQDGQDSQGQETILPDMEGQNFGQFKIQTIEPDHNEEQIENENVIKILATTEADGTIVFKGTDGVQYYTDTQLVTGEDGELHEEEVIFCDGDDNSQFQILKCDSSELVIEYAGDTDQIATVYQQEDGSYVCDCGDQFQDLDEYEKHQFKHNPAGDHLCNLCGKGFESVEMLTGHLALHRTPGPVIPCPYCAQLVKRNTITQHIKFAHNKIKPQCSLCAKTFANANNLKRHLMIHSGVREFECDICFKRFNQKITMQTHRLTHISPYSCHECDSMFDTKANLAAHRESNECPKTKVTQVKLDLIKTVKQEVTSNLGKLLGYACSLCKKMFSLESALEQHVESVHMVEQSELSCMECDELFSTKKELQSHMIVHKVYKNRNVKRFECNSCGKGCASQAMLIMHERVHTNERPFNCEHCTLAFKTKTHLRTHQLTHTREKKFGCSVCMKFFALKGNLVVHLRTHTGERPYTCSLCGESFIDSKYLKKHKLKKHDISNAHWNEY